MKTNLLAQFLSVLLQVGAVVFALTCFSGPAQADTVLAPVGPTPPGAYAKVDCGYLMVYSRTQQTTWGEGTTYYPHTAYWIYDSAGNRIKTVNNNANSTDERPEKVELAPGTYKVRAWSDSDGMVTVPVVVKLARTTSVHLDNGKACEQSPAHGTAAVTSPSGQVVGWKA